MFKKRNYLVLLLPIISLIITTWLCMANSIDKGGEEINLSRLLVPEKTNIINFYEEGNVTCKRFFPYLESLASNNKDIVVLKINIKDLNSPVCKEFNITTVPYFMIYNEKGILKCQGDEAKKEIAQMIKPYLPQTVAQEQKQSQTTNNGQNTGNTSGQGKKILNADNPGGEVDIKKSLVYGKTNIIDFYADW